MAVIVNEFGEIGIDHHMIAKVSSNIVELTNGCVCCSIREDLLTTIKQILQQESKWDYVLVETTGLADPGPIAQTFFHPSIETSFRLDALVTLVDGENFRENIEHSEVTLKQIALADLLVVSKRDLVTGDVFQQVEESLKSTNPYARVIPAIRGKVPLELLLGTFSRQDREKILKFPGVHEQMRIQSFAFQTEQPLSLPALQEWAQNIPRNIFRGKGLVRMERERKPYLFHLVGSRVTIDPFDQYSDTDFQTQIVLIGKDLDKESLQQGLASCVASPKKRRFGLSRKR